MELLFSYDEFKEKINDEKSLDLYMKKLKNVSDEDKSIMLEKIFLIKSKHEDPVSYIKMLDKIKEYELTDVKVDFDSIFETMVVCNPLLISTPGILNKMKEIYKSDDRLSLSIISYSGEMSIIQPLIANMQDLKMLKEIKDKITIPLHKYADKRNEKLKLIDKKIKILEEKNILNKLLFSEEKNSSLKKRI